ncbi:MAG TPA: ATP-binding protein [bacterium]
MNGIILLPRDILGPIKKWLDKPEIIVLLGARQVGKSSIMKLLMREMTDDECIYLDLEDTYNLQIVSGVDKFLEYLSTQKLHPKKRIKVFIDEFQYLPEPAKFLKLIHDHHQEIKLIISGSSSFEIRKKFTDALTGRKIVFTIYPLSFTEYLAFKKSPYRENKESIDLFRILRHFDLAKAQHLLTPKIQPVLEDFIIYGGYPLPSLTNETEARILRLKEIHNTYVQKDIKDLAKLENIPQFNRLIMFLSVQNGSLLNLNEVGKETGIKRRHLEKYLFLLEKTFVINTLRPYYRNRQKEITKMPKLYFGDTGLRNININDTRSLDKREDAGCLAETFFYSEFLKKRMSLTDINFWRDKQQHEVDFVLVENRVPMPVEIKFQRFTKPDVPPSLKNFMEKFKPKRAVVITRDYLDRIKIKTEIYFIPLWMI